MFKKFLTSIASVFLVLCIYSQNVYAMQIENGVTFRTDFQTESLVITEEPMDVQAISGKTAAFEIKAEGTGLTYQWWWRSSSASTEWMKYEVGKSARLEIVPDGGWDGYQFRCVVTDQRGRQETSEPGTVKMGPVITEEPMDVQAISGETAVFEIKAEGTGLTYQWWWRSSSASTEWMKYEVGKSARLEIVPDGGWDGYQFRCVVTDQRGRQETSEPGTVRILKSINPSINISCDIDTGKEEKIIAEGSNFTLEASTENSISIQWQSSSDGSTFSDIAGENGPFYTYTNSPAPLEDQTVYYRAVATSSTGNTAVSNVIEVLLLSEDELPIRPQSDLMGSNSVENSESETVSETQAVGAGAADSENADEVEDKSVSGVENNDTGLAKDLTSENNTETQTEKETGSEPEAESETQDMTADVSAEAQ